MNYAELIDKYIEFLCPKSSYYPEFISASIKEMDVKGERLKRGFLDCLRYFSKTYITNEEKLLDFEIYSLQYCEISTPSSFCNILIQFHFDEIVIEFKNEKKNFNDCIMAFKYVLDIIVGHNY